MFRLLLVCCGTTHDGIPAVQDRAPQWARGTFEDNYFSTRIPRPFLLSPPGVSLDVASGVGGSRVIPGNGRTAPAIGEARKGRCDLVHY